MTTPRFMTPTERGAHRDAVLRGPKPLLVGECNPYPRGLDPRYALYPYPENSAGGRLCFKIMGLTRRREYIARFDRVNLCTGKWNMKEAKEHAWALLGTRQERRTDRARCVIYDMQRPLVLFGAKVARAFGQDFRPFTWQKVFDQKGLVFPTSHPIVTLPHPSGLSRAWNEPGAYERARAVLREAGVL